MASAAGRRHWEDDKSRPVLDFLSPLVQSHFAAAAATSGPFFLGINGIQGAGKTTLVRDLAAALRAPPLSRSVAVLSVDDLYLPRAAQQQLAAANPANPLVRHRGQPGTHDVALGARLFDDLRHRRAVRLPAYDKSAFAGQGDRVPEERWERLNGEGEPPVDVVVFEGWCVGFRPLGQEVLKQKWELAADAVRQGKDGEYKGQLGRNELASVQFVNERLREYDQLTDSLHALVHIDAEDTHWVYDWRLEQEQELREQKGSGMTDEQVCAFVDGYYPAYELYTDALRDGVFDAPGRQLRIIVGRDRKVKKLIDIYKSAAVTPHNRPSPLVDIYMQLRE